jgi:formyltetrahydrofolate synthetase
MKSDGEINQAASLKSIDEIVKSLDIKTDDLNFYGPYQAKLKPSVINTLKEPKTAKLLSLIHI